VSPTSAFGSRVYAAAFTLPSKPESLFILGGSNGNGQAYPTVDESTDGGVNWSQVGGTAPFLGDGTVAATNGVGDTL
jgi:hypothetical protein